MTILALDLCVSEFQRGDEFREAGASRPGPQAGAWGPVTPGRPGLPGSDRPGDTTRRATAPGSGGEARHHGILSGGIAKQGPQGDDAEPERSDQEPAARPRVLTSQGEVDELLTALGR